MPSINKQKTNSAPRHVVPFRSRITIPRDKDGRMVITDASRNVQGNPRDIGQQALKAATGTTAIKEKVSALRDWGYSNVAERMKRLLFRLPRPNSPLAKTERMVPKTQVSILSLAAFIVSALAFLSHLAPGSAVSALPALEIFRHAPALLCLIAAILSGWCFVSHPMVGRRHGIMKKKDDDAIDAFGVPKNRDDALGWKYAKLHASLGEIFAGEYDRFVYFPMVPNTLTGVSDRKSIDVLVDAMSYGKIRIMDVSPYERYRYRSLQPSLQGNADKIEDMDSLLAEYDEICRQFKDVSLIWSSSLGFGGSYVRLHLGDLSYSTASKELPKEMAELGRKLGVDTAIEAYMSGVPLEDIVA